MVQIKKKKLKKIIEGLNGMTREEWEAIKPYIEHKLKYKGFLDDPNLLYMTLEYYFVEVIP